MAVSGFSVLALLVAFLVQLLVGVESKCSAENSSGLRVVFDSHQNTTGHWTHSAGIINRGLPKQSTPNQQRVEWKVDVDYKPEFCGEDSRDSLDVLISFTVPNSKRNADYTLYPGLGYYKLRSTVDTWPVAKEACEKEGAHLAIINSQQEADMMIKLLANITTPWTWVGLTKNDPRGEFTTVFGDPISSTGFSKWYPGINPSNAAALSSAVIHRTAATYSYSSNTARYPSICEQSW